MHTFSNLLHQPRWTELPDMQEPKWNTSALCLNSGSILVVGGSNQTSHPGDDVELLTYRETEEDGSWEWRELALMNEYRPLSPGMLLLGDRAGDDGDKLRVLVAGGSSSGTLSAEVLHLSLNDEFDQGQWTLISQMNSRFELTYLVNFTGRVFAFGESTLRLGSWHQVFNLGFSLT